MADFAASHGWKGVSDDALDHRLQDIIHRLSWVLHGRRYPNTLVRVSPQQTYLRDAYAGSVRDRQALVANAWTNIGPQELVRTYEMQGVSVCAVELPTLSPILLVQTRQYPAVERYPETATGNAEFDSRFILAGAPGLGAQAVTPELQRLIMARDDWAFAGHDSWLACVTRDPFESSDDVQQLLDAVMATVAALPASVVPSEVDRSADDLLARAEQLSSPEEVVAYLGQLSPEDRQRLAQSDTPLAAFADVTSWDDVLARLQSLDVAQRMQLLAMFKRARSSSGA
jgi:hypothetical protein